MDLLRTTASLTEINEEKSRGLAKGALEAVQGVRNSGAELNLCTISGHCLEP